MTEFNQKVLIFFPFLMLVTNIMSRWWSWGGRVADIWGPRKFSDGASNHLIFWHKLGNFFVLFRWFLWIFRYFSKEEDLLCHSLHCPLNAIKKLASVLHFEQVVCANHQKLSFHTFDQNCQKFAKTVSDNTKQVFFYLLIGAWAKCGFVLVCSWSGWEVISAGESAKDQISQRSTKNTLL